MKGQVVIALLFLLSRSAQAGSPCPSAQTILPCACSNRDDGFTLVVCAGIQNNSQLEEATRSLKSMFVDHLMMINTFSDGQNVANEISNEVDSKPTSISLDGIFPKRWLAEVRVRHLDIQNSKLNGYFLVEDVLKGQSDFLTRLSINNADLKGHVCYSCGPASNTVAFSTSELRKTTFLNQIDLSYNKLEVVDGMAFPPTLKELKKIVLSNNHINRVHDNAFSNLHQLSHLDLSRNRLTAFSRKVFRTTDQSLNILDLSYNSIQVLPDNMFTSLQVLKEVKLSYNTMETLPESTWLQLPTLLEKIDVRGNFLVCNCTMKWIARRMSKSTKLVGQCVGSRGLEFFDLKPTLPSITTCT